MPKRSTTPARPATSADVARLAGVSRSAVSRTFTEGASVSSPTRRKVLAAAKALRYRPNLFASSLKTRRSYIIGVAVSELANQSYPEMLQRLSEEFARFGYRVLLFITHGSTGHDPVLDELLRFHLDALVLASSSLSSSLARDCRAAGMPVVMINNVDPTGHTTSVAGTNELGGRTVAAYMAACGHRRFAYLGGLAGNSATQQRLAGFTSWLVKHGHPAPACVSGDFTYDTAVQLTRTLLRDKRPPDAIFCINDLAAMAALQTARTEFGLAVGKDISIIGFDNVPIASWPAFALTTYSQPMVKMVPRLVQRVVQLLTDRNAPPAHDEIHGELIVRGSARLPPGGLIDGENGDRIWRPATPL